MLAFLKYKNTQMRVIDIYDGYDSTVIGDFVQKINEKTLYLSGGKDE